MKENEQIFIDLAKQGVFKIEKDGTVYKVMKKHKEYMGYKPCTPKKVGHISGNGYARFGFDTDDYRGLKVFLHRVIWIWFNGDIPNKMQINHKNGIKTDNRLENLEVVTQSENMHHARFVLKRKMGNFTKGPDKAKKYVKLTENYVKDIRFLANYNIKLKRISEIYKVSDTMIRYIIERKTHKYI